MEETTSSSHSKNKDTTSEINDYCCAGEVGERLMRDTYERMKSLNLNAAEWEQERVGGISPWLMQIYTDFPWLEVACTPVRCQGRHATYLPRRGDADLVFAPDALVAQMVAQDIALRFIASNVKTLTDSPPLWIEDWQEIVQRIVAATRLTVNTREVECFQLARIYEEHTLQFASSESTTTTTRDSAVSRLIQQSTLASYFRSWEFAYGKLIDVIHTVSTVMVKLSEEGPSLCPEGRDADMKLLDNFAGLSLATFTTPYNRSKLYTSFMMDPERYVFTFGFYVDNDLSPDAKLQLSARASAIELVMRAMQKGGEDKQFDVKGQCKRRLWEPVLNYMDDLVKKMGETDYGLVAAPATPPPPPAVVEEEEEKVEEMVAGEHFTTLDDDDDSAGDTTIPTPPPPSPSPVLVSSSLDEEGEEEEVVVVVAVE